MKKIQYFFKWFFSFFYRQYLVIKEYIYIGYQFSVKDPGLCRLPENKLQAIFEGEMMMKKIILGLFGLLVLGLCNGCKKDEVTSTQEKITIQIEYPLPGLFESVHQTLIEKFNTTHPHIKVIVRKKYQTYEDGLQSILRSNLTNDLPDITFQGLNRFRVLIDKNIAVSLNQLIEQEQNFNEKGFNQLMYESGKFGDQIYGLPFAISLPIVYYNMDLVRRAGWNKDRLPETWEEVYELARKIDALEADVYGLYYSWQLSGNWLWQALLFSQGGQILTDDEKEIAFGGKEGQWAIDTFWNMFSQANQPNHSYPDASSEFVSGLCGIWITSTSALHRVSQMIGGKFELITAPFPSVNPETGRLPAGGNGALILTRDRARQKAAWEVLKFWCGEEGSYALVTQTGYMPPNQLVIHSRLSEFYLEHPNHLSAVGQLSKMKKWYAFPGENSLKITDVIYNYLEQIATGKSNSRESVLENMVRDVRELLP